MGTIKLQYLEKNSVTSKGKKYVYYFYRREGHRIKLPSPEHPTFSAEYNRVHKSFEQGTIIEGHYPGSFGHLVEAYKSSPEFKSLAAKTRKDYTRYMEPMAIKFGDLMVAGISREFVLRYRDQFADKPTTANYVIRVLRLLLTYAIDRDQTYGLKHNPASRPKRLKTGEGHRPWEEYEIEQFQNYWKPESIQRVAFELFLNSGQRGGDVVAMARSHYRNGNLAVKQEKTGTHVDVPASQDLKNILDPYLRTHNHMVILLNASGSAFGIDNFRHFMREAYRQAGLPDDCTNHGLRYTAATRLYELGCDWETIGAITGHKTGEMVRKYTEKKRRSRLAISRLDDARGEQNQTSLPKPE